MGWRDTIKPESKSSWRDTVQPDEDQPSSSDKALSALSGFGNAATFGYLPQIQSLVAQGVDKAAGFEPEPYVKTRDRFIKQAKATEEKAPGYALAGSLAGTLATPVPGVGSGGLLAKMGKAAVSGAAQGALYNPGDVEGEVSGLQLGERASNAAKSGLFSAGAQGLIGAAGKAASAWGNKAEKLRDASDVAAIESLGSKSRDIQTLMDKGTEKDVAKFVRDSGMIKAGESFESALERAQAINAETGNSIKKVYQTVKQVTNDPAFLKSLGPDDVQTLFKSELITDDIKNEVMSVVKEAVKGKSKSAQAVKSVESAIESMSELGPVADIDQMWNFRKSLDKVIDFDRPSDAMDLTTEALQKARAVINDKIKNRIDAFDKIKTSLSKAGVPSDLLGSLKTLNKNFSSGITAERILENKVARELANRRTGLIPALVGTGIGSVAAGSQLMQGETDPVKYAGALGAGLLAAKATKLGRNYGPALATKSLDALARIAEKDPTAKASRALGRAVESLPSNRTSDLVTRGLLLRGY